MNALAAVLLLLFLGACTSFRHIAYGDSSSEHPTMPAARIMLAGQSNMGRFSQYAEDAFRESFGPADFVPCFVGGTESSQWLPGGDFFNGCIEAAGAKPIDAILYWQGESDAYNERTNWGPNFTATIEGLRQHFGNVPVVFAQIAITSGSDWGRGWASVQQQQAAVHLPNAVMIRTADLAALEDVVHLTPMSLQRIAPRFAAALRELMNPNTNPKKPAGAGAP